MQKPFIKFAVEPDGAILRVVGRDAWCLRQLLNSGDRGFTTLENPAPRVSHYIFKLRRAGLIIESKEEKHGGLYSGRHSRYILHTRIRVLADEKTTEVRP